jgi:hypothetical protein
MSNKRWATAFCASATAFSLAFSSTAFAQGMAMDKPIPAVPQNSASQYTVKTLAENQRLQVRDLVVPPGAALPTEVRLGRVYYYVHGGTVERTFADGSKRILTRKAGEAVINTEERPYSVKNIGKTTIEEIGVVLK